MKAMTRFFHHHVRLGLLGGLFALGFGVVGPVTTAGGLDAPAGSTKDEVKLETVSYEEMVKRIASKKAKLTVVDAWATWCGPCMANFHHIVDLSDKYAGKGIAFASISLDDSSKPKKVADATEFLKSKKANFSNYLLKEPQDEAFEKLDISTISAVFLFGPDGKEVRRFTQEDPNHQFTYAEVETAVQEFLAGKPMTTGEAPKKR